MKKTFVIFLSLVYLVLSSGFTQYSHQCKTMVIKQYSLTNAGHQNSDKPCPFCAAKDKGLKDKKKDCCKNEAKIVKVDNSIKKQNQFDFSIKFWGGAIPNKMLGTVFDFPVVAKTSSRYLSHEVPIPDNPLYILHCVYRI